jgi:hypothetical protein
MDEGPEIDHCQFSRGALRHSRLRAYRENMEKKGTCLPACARYRSPQLVATETLTIGRSAERAHVLVSTVA